MRLIEGAWAIFQAPSSMLEFDWLKYTLRWLSHALGLLKRTYNGLDRLEWACYGLNFNNTTRIILGVLLSSSQPKPWAKLSSCINPSMIYQASLLHYSNICMKLKHIEAYPSEWKEKNELACRLHRLEWWWTGRSLVPKPSEPSSNPILNLRFGD